MNDLIKRNKSRDEEIERCEKLLVSRNPRDRSFAARRLGELGADPKLLISLFSDSNGFVRSTAAEALGRSAEMPNAEVVTSLLAAIDDPNNYVCAAAVNSLGLLKITQATDQIIACLDDEHPIIVQAAILALARIAPEKILPHLLSLIDSEEYLIHLAATRAAGWLNYQPAGEQIIKRLEDLINNGASEDLKLPKLYIEVISRLQLREAIPVLVKVSQKEVGLRGAAVEALVELNTEEAAPILSPLLSDPSNRLRRNLIEMMVQANYIAALPLIRPLLRDNSITVRETALMAVSKWHDLISVDDVRSIAFNDPNPFVRPQAVFALAGLLGVEAQPDLIKLANDVNAHVRKAVVQALGRLPYLADESKAVLDRLTFDPEVADLARQALKDQNFTPPEPGDVMLMLPKAPVPGTLDDHDIQKLLELLDIWQEGLPEMRHELDLEKISELDQVISTLVIALREAQECQYTLQQEAIKSPSVDE